MTNLMEQQLNLFGADSSDIKWELVQFRETPEVKRDFSLLCRGEFGLDVSKVLRIVIRKLLSNRREFSGVMRNQEPTKELDVAVNEIIGYLPVIAKQIKYNRNLY